MALAKTDFSQIEKMFDRLEEKIQKQIQESEGRLNKKIIETEHRLNESVFDVDEKLSSKIEATNNRIEQTETKIVTVISQEIADLAEINREVIKRVDRIDELDKRMVRLETKLGLKPL